MNNINTLLRKNKEWAEEKLRQNPNFFKDIAKEQQPNFFWIGCSDSRVPVSEITGCKPGDIFVNRNVANLVVNTDISLLTTLQYAVEVLNVKHIVVCGHYGCGGVKLALSNEDAGIAEKWVSSIKDVYLNNKDELEKISNEEEKCNKLVEFNVKHQVNNLIKNSIIQNAWNEEQELSIHGLIYNMQNGELKEIYTKNSSDDLDPIYIFKQTKERKSLANLIKTGLRTFLR